MRRLGGQALQEVPPIQYRRPRSNVRSRPEYEYALLSQLRLAYRVQSALHPLTFAPVPPVPGAWTFARLYSESHTVSS
jgi:hypothetical protein